MTYQQFIELINMPQVLFLLAVVTFLITIGVCTLIDWLRS